MFYITVIYMAVVLHTYHITYLSHYIPITLHDFRITWLSYHMMWKSGLFCFITQFSNKFQWINFVTCKNLVHCGYFKYTIFSHSKYINQNMACQTFWSGIIHIWLELPRRRLPHKKSCYFPHHYQLRDLLVIFVCIRMTKKIMGNFL